MSPLEFRGNRAIFIRTTSRGTEVTVDSGLFYPVIPSPPRHAVIAPMERRVPATLSGEWFLPSLALMNRRASPLPPETCPTRAVG
jgi:hypothetical protein